MLCFFFLKCMFAKKYSQKLLVLLVAHLQSVFALGICASVIFESPKKSQFSKH